MDPFQENFVVVLAAGEANGGAFKTVATGKRAVIEHVSVYGNPAAARLADYFITSTIEDNSAFREVPIVTALTPSGFILGSHPLRAYAAPGTQFGGVIRRYGDLTQRISATFVFSGYYVPVP